MSEYIAGEACDLEHYIDNVTLGDTKLCRVIRFTSRRRKPYVSECCDASLERPLCRHIDALPTILQMMSANASVEALRKIPQIRDRKRGERVDLTGHILSRSEPAIQSFSDSVLQKLCPGRPLEVAF